MKKVEVLMKLEVHVPREVKDKDLLAYVIRNWDNHCIVKIKGLK